MNSQARTEWIWKLRAFPWFPLRLRMIFMPPGKQAATNGTTKTNTRKCNQKLRKHSMQINFSFNCSVSASSVGFPQRGARFTAEQGSNGREALMNPLVVCNSNRQLFEMSFIRWSIEQSSLAGFIWLKWVSMSEKFSINCQFTSRGCMAAATGLAVIKSVWFEPEILIQRLECSTHSIIWSDQRPASFVRQTREEKKFEKKKIAPDWSWIPGLSDDPRFWGLWRFPKVLVNRNNQELCFVIAKILLARVFTRLRFVAGRNNNSLMKFPGTETTSHSHCSLRTLSWCYWLILTSSRKSFYFVASEWKARAQWRDRIERTVAASKKLILTKRPRITFWRWKKLIPSSLFSFFLFSSSSCHLGSARSRRWIALRSHASLAARLCKISIVV